MMLSGCRVPRILHSVPVTQRAEATWDLRPQSWTWSLVRGQALSLGLGDLLPGRKWEPGCCSSRPSLLQGREPSPS